MGYIDFCFNVERGRVFYLPCTFLFFFIASFHKMLSGFMGSDNGNFIDLFLLFLRHKLLSTHFEIFFINSRKKLRSTRTCIWSPFGPKNVFYHNSVKFKLQTQCGERELCLLYYINFLSIVAVRAYHWQLSLDGL